MFNFSDGNIHESDEHLNAFFNKFQAIICTHYEFIPKELEMLFEKICDNIHDLERSGLYDSLIELNKYVVKNYDVLRTKLKLPNDAFKSRFYRMNHTEKLQLIITIIGKMTLIFVYILTFMNGVNLLLNAMMIDFKSALFTMCTTISLFSVIFFALKQ